MLDRFHNTFYLIIIWTNLNPCLFLVFYNLLLPQAFILTFIFRCRLFQKVDQWMNKDEQLDNDAKKRLEDANQVKTLQVV